jgi:hypothetical protein
MTTSTFETSLKEAVAIPIFLLLLGSGSLLVAQEPPYSAPDSSFEQAPPLFSASELTNLVAPIALYPDPLLSQVLVVSTYPQELVEAQQWLQQNGNLEGEQLMYAARQQNWDPSVQALVAFPDVMALLNSNIQWTTALGQAFLAQPIDVMNAIQNLRAQARYNGQLADTPQLSINSEFQNGQSAIEIQPADPQVMYVPAYNPYSVWGPPVAGSYPALPYEGSTFGSLIGSAINLAGLFAGFPGLLGPSGWGWALSWLAHTLFVNNSFLSNFGFRNTGAGSGGSTVWAHNAGYRAGAPYAQSGSGWRTFGGGAGGFAGARSGTAFAPPRSFGGRNFQASNWGEGSGNWRRFESDARRPPYQAPKHFAPPSWSSNRDLEASNRFAPSAYPTRAASYRAPFTDWRSRAPSAGGFSKFYNDRARSAPQAVEQSSRSWRHPFRSSQPRMDSGHSFWSGRSSAPRSPKPQHLPKMPHFSAPHFKSHGSSHFSRGHSGGKSHHYR